MKKLMLIATVLMIAGGLSAHGYGGNHGGYRGGYGGYHERVVVRPYYNPYIAVRPAPMYYSGYGYAAGPVYRGYGGYHGGYRGGRCR